MKADRKEIAAVALAALVVSFIYYGRFLNNFFAYDDFKYLANFVTGGVDLALGYNTLRLVSNLSWVPLHAASGLDPFGYNLFGLLLYAANGALLYFFLLHLVKDRTFAILGGLFFMLTSVGADAVFWKASNSSLISLFFYLGTLIAYLAYRRAGSNKYYLASLALYLLAAFSKEEAASLPFILVLIEILFMREVRAKVLLLRIAPFCAVIVFYVFSNWVVFNFLLHGHAEPENLFQFRPLHTLLTGGAAFFLAPDGRGLTAANPAIYLTAAGLAASFFLVRDRRLFYFGMGWIFFAFLPQSLTSLGQFEPRTMCNSISRYLYITSIGSSVILSALLLSVRDKTEGRRFAVIATVVIALFASFHFPRVQQRGEGWQRDWEPTRTFLATVKKVAGTFPPRSHVFVANPPSGTTFLMQGLRAYCGQADISGIRRPDYVSSNGEPSFFIYRSLLPDGIIMVYPFEGELGYLLISGRKAGWLGPLPGLLDPVNEQP